ncbi:T9SS type A sorting domain-containing protein [Chryseobacterium sp.]|uniref:T9SS type A sorting domain-containing protein n=1 Tax=Chryseobacterium sp. TaxID=1871047 RepID=UPI002FC77C2F
MNLIFKLFLLWTSIISMRMYSQEFYVNTIIPTYPHNTIFKLNISNSNESIDYLCLPTANVNEFYSDIAIDQSNNLYYVTNDSGLYKRNSTNSTCEYLGQFSNGNTNSLVADSGHLLYAVSIENSGIKLYKYDNNSGVFTSMGYLPPGHSPSGDLFFYENRLFLTTSNGILEINMINPSQSCKFMDLNIPNLYAAFSFDYGTYSKAYIISKAINYPYNSTLHEIDMNTKQLGSPIRSYIHNIYGAATSYNLTSSNSTCTPTLSIQEIITDTEYLNVINPAENNIIVQTNVKRSEITSIRLFDNSGRLIKDFSNQNNIVRLEISGIVSGNYLLSLSTKNGKTYTKKIIIKS